jgi:hypothetical protein
MSDAEAVADSEVLLRRIHPTFNRPDGSVSSQAFKDLELSVDRLALLTSAEEALDVWKGYGLAALDAGDVRRLGLEVKADPLDDNPAHALILGNKTKAIARRLARMATWVRRINQ